MARFKIADADKYGGQGGGGFFSLKNNGDWARVRVMYRNLSDVEGYCVHEVSIAGKKRYVDCLREHDDPIEKCPFCKTGNRTQVRFFVPFYMVDEDRIRVWERGKAYVGKMKELFDIYANDKPLISTVFRVTKHVTEEGSCSYDFASEYNGNVDLDDFDMTPQPVYGGLVLQKTAAEMEKYLLNGQF